MRGYGPRHDVPAKDDADKLGELQATLNQAQEYLASLSEMAGVSARRVALLQGQVNAAREALLG